MPLTNSRVPGGIVGPFSRDSLRARLIVPRLVSPILFVVCGVLASTGCSKNTSNESPRVTDSTGEIGPADAVANPVENQPDASSDDAQDDSQLVQIESAEMRELDASSESIESTPQNIARRGQSETAVDVRVATGDRRESAADEKIELAGGATFQKPNQNSKSKPTPALKPEPNAAAKPEVNKAKMPFEDWDAPNAILVITGQQHGHMKPCGCSPEFQRGGLMLRHGFIEWLKPKGWPMSLLDLGGLLEDHTEQIAPGKIAVGPEQSGVKMDITLKALTTIGYDILNLAPEDLEAQGGLDGLAGKLINLANKPIVLSSNIEIEPAYLQLGLFRRDVLMQVDQMKIGVTGAIGESYKKRVEDLGIKFQEPSTAVLDVLKDWSKDKSIAFKVLLLYGDVDEARKLARSKPEFDVIVHADSVDEPRGNEVLEAKTLIVTVGTNGKHAGGIGLYRNGLKGQRIQRAKFELVPLDERFSESKEMQKLVHEEYLESLAHLDLIRKHPKRPFNLQNPKVTFVGSETCKECHPNTYNKWEETEHAKAMESLVEGRRKGRELGLGKGSQVDPECVLCHATGFSFKSGYDGTDATLVLANNGCENCHGAASEHVAAWKKLNLNEEEAKKANRHVRAGAQTPQKNDCIRCHDQENDPHWDFDKRWAEIDHGAEAGDDRDLWDKIKRTLAEKQGN